MYAARKINHRPWPVKVILQDFDGKEVVESEHVFIGYFKSFSEDDFAKILRDIDGEGDDVADRLKSMSLADSLWRNARIFERLMVGWSDIFDGDGAPLPFTPAALRDEVTGPNGLAVSAAINVAIAELRFGAASAKNSQTSASAGLAPAGVVPAATS